MIIDTDALRIALILEVGWQQYIASVGGATILRRADWLWRWRDTL